MRPKKLKRRWRLFVALAERISEQNQWEWLATFRDRPDAMAFGRQYTTTFGPLVGSARVPNGWKFTVTSKARP